MISFSYEQKKKVQIRHQSHQMQPLRTTTVPVNFVNILWLLQTSVFVMFMPYALLSVPTGGFISFTKLHLQRVLVSSASHRKILSIASWDHSSGTFHARASFFMR